MFLKVHYFKASTQSLKEEGALENHASVFETHTSMKMQWFFSWDTILITFEEYSKLQSQTKTWLCRRVHDIEICAKLNYGL